MNISRKQFIEELCVYLLCLSPLGVWAYKKWKEYRAKQQLEQWSRVALPLVRKVFPNLVAKDLVSVQPMTAATGLAFYMDYRYTGPSNYPRNPRTTRRRRGCCVE